MTTAGLAIADFTYRRLFIVGLDGKARTIAGTGTGGEPPTCGNFSSDGPLATTVPLCKPKGRDNGARWIHVLHGELQSWQWCIRRAP